MEKWLFVTFLCAGMLVFNSCNEEEIPTYQINEPVIDTSDYTGSPVTFLYSLDYGITFTPTMPADITDGRVLLVKTNDGTEDLTKENYLFDWSGATPAPLSSTSDLATFLVEEDINIKLKLSDILIMVANEKTSGKFYSVNTTNGSKIETFSPTYNGSTLNEIRALVFHPNQNKYYASQESSAGGSLFSINPLTNEATLINENDGNDGHEAWTEVTNWMIAADDSLLSVGDFAGEGSGLVKFGTNGERANTTADLGVCCGLGLSGTTVDDEIFLSDGSSAGLGEINLNVYSVSGVLKTRQTIRHFQDFPADLSADELSIKSLAEDSAERLYGLLYDETTGVTYFVRVYNISGVVAFISTIGEDGDIQFNSLAFIPKHFL